MSRYYNHRVSLIKNINVWILMLSICALLLFWLPYLSIPIASITLAFVFYRIFTINTTSRVIPISVALIIASLITSIVFTIYTRDNSNIKTDDTTQSKQSKSDKSSIKVVDTPNNTWEAKNTEPKISKEKEEKIKSANFLDERSLSLIFKSPDSHSGEIFKVWGEITQFDAATGNNTFRADIANRDIRSYGYWLGGNNSMLTGSTDILKKFVEEDIFTATVEVYGSYSYDTQIGGNTTVPKFIVHNIQLK